MKIPHRVWRNGVWRKVVRRSIRSMMGAGLAFSLLLLISLTVRASHGPLPNANWVETITSAMYDFEVHHVPCGAEIGPGCEPGTHWFPTLQAFDAANALDQSQFLFDSFDFPDGNQRDVWFYDCNLDGDCDNGLAGHGAIFMPAPVYSNRSASCVRAILLHELFHKVQSAWYPNFSDNWSKSVGEGQARMMQDKLFADLDDDPAASCVATYLGSVASYLGNPGQNLLKADYETSLFWTYLTEQFSSLDTEPYAGVDFIRRWWENASDVDPSSLPQNDIMAVTVQTMRQSNANATFGGVFQNFTIANIAKDFDLSPLPAAEERKYSYADDAALGNYASITIGPGRKGAISQGNPYEISALLLPYSARYYEVDVTGCQLGSTINLRTQQSLFGGLDPIGVALIGVRDDNPPLVRDIDKIIAGPDKTITMIKSAPVIHRVIVVISSRDVDPVFGSGDVGLRISCGLPAQIDLPLEYHVQPHYGDAENPFNVFDMTVGVQGEGEPVPGLTREDFEVYAGDPDDPANRATVLSALQMQEGYQLIVQAPDKPVGRYPLVVRMGESEARRDDALPILAGHSYDRILLIDRTVSMEQSSKLLAAQSGARLFVDASADRGTLGVIGLGGPNMITTPLDDATVQRQLSPINDTLRQEAQAAIDEITTDKYGLTAIGSGLRLALNEFDSRGAADGIRHVILLADDGEASTTARWADVQSAVQDGKVIVHTIALGPSSDQGLLQQIAQETGGAYYYVDVERGVINLPNRLADVYLAIADGIEGRDRFWQVENRVAAGRTASHAITLPTGLEQGLFVANWTNPKVQPAIELLRPDGTPVQHGVDGVRIYQDETHVAIHVDNVNGGIWTFNTAHQAGTLHYFAAFSAIDTTATPLLLELGPREAPLGDPDLAFARGLPLPIYAIPGDTSGALAKVRASVEHPDGSKQSIPLFDDGTHGDAFEEDGIYTGLYYRTTITSPTGFVDSPQVQRGSYRVMLEVERPDTQAIKSRATSFQIHSGGLPSVAQTGASWPAYYATLHPCLDPTAADGDPDSDEDGLTSSEEYAMGLLPCIMDSDGGGEHDGSEVARGANPLDPLDDALPRPIDVEVLTSIDEHMEGPMPQPLANLIRYPVNPAYTTIVLQRSQDPSGPFPEVARFSAPSEAGYYLDDELQNGVTYYYRLQALTQDGAASSFSPLFSGMAKQDPVPPHGSAILNRGAGRTDSPNVICTMAVYNTDPGEVEMLIANDAQFTDADWQPFQANVPWTLPAPANSKPATMFVKFRDAEHNESRVYSASIVLDAPGTLGAIEGVAQLTGRTEHGNIAVHLVDAPTLPGAQTGADGSYDLATLPPATYDLTFVYPGFTAQTVAGVVVEASKATRLPTVTLLPQQDRLLLPLITSGN